MSRASLGRYRSKRDFGRTPEPAADRHIKHGDRLRFVIQKHAARRLHYDLRLEMGGAFKSWAVPKGPSLDPGEKRLAVQVEDHPLAYGDFEGTIPKGQYGGGTVQLWDRGYWLPVGEGSPAAQLRAGRLQFELEGKRLKGRWALVHMRSKQEGKPAWLLIKHPDRHARPGEHDQVLADDRSVASGRPMKEIAAGRGRAPAPFMSLQPAASRGPSSRRASRKPSPEAAARGSKAGVSIRFVEPQLCQLVDNPPVSPDWCHEVKLDGYRMQLRVQNARSTLWTRAGLDWSHRFPEIAAAATSLPDCLIDGEIVALDTAGSPSFSTLQTRLSSGDTGELTFYAFDLLFVDGHACREQPLEWRKMRLKELLAPLSGPSIRYVEHFNVAGDAILQSACRASLEGIVSKERQAPYKSGRTGSWKKSKCRAGQEVVVGGWSQDGARLRSLLVGTHDEAGELRYAGRVGTGFSADTAAECLRRLRPLEARQSPFAGPNAPDKATGIHWARPRLVVEIQFAGWTAAGLVRQAAFKGIRMDKSARSVAVEAPVASSEGVTEVNGVEITNPQKVLWPADGATSLTKLDLAVYFDRMSAELMPYVAGRPCTVVRAPDGIAGQQFIQRHPMGGTSPLISLVSIRGDRQKYLQVDRPEAIIALAQIAAIELHPWNCRPGEPEIPGRLVFDLDPGPDVGFDLVVAAAREANARLQSLRLAGFCKTTGGKGLHVVVPLAEKGAGDWSMAKAFAGEFCQRMAADSPGRYVTTMAKRARQGRIFLDYLRNDRTATAVAVLSPRARAGAPVSTPLAWTQVRAGLNPDRHALTTVAAGCFLRAWPDYGEAEGSLAEAARRLLHPPPVIARRMRNGESRRRGTAR